MQVPRLLSEYTLTYHPEVELRVRQLIVAASRGMVLHADLTPLLATITCPTLVMVGEQDGLAPSEVAQAYASQIPNAQVVTIPQSRHLSNQEQRAAFLTAVRTFLRTLGA